MEPSASIWSVLGSVAFLVGVVSLIAAALAGAMALIDVFRFRWQVRQFGTPDVVVTINGQKFLVDDVKPLSFRDVADLARVPTQYPTVTLRMKGIEGRNVHPGESVNPLNGMVFNVADTGAA